MDRLDRDKEKIATVALIGNYLPRKCGIATFTTDIRNALITRYPDLRVDVYAMEDGAQDEDYPSEVVATIADDNVTDYIVAAQRINESRADVIWLQHEYGIFGGPAGELILRLLDRVSAPLVVTLHTILADPNPDQRRVMDAILRRASRIIVMAEMGRRLLEEVHHVEPERVTVIPHGIPDRPLEPPATYKPRFGFEGRKVLLTFGLLSPNKGLETVIEAMPRIVACHPEVLYVILGATHPHLLMQQGEAYREKLARRADELGISENLMFINAFVETDLLLDYLASADIYVTPYLNEAQVTSGTLSYAIGVGKPVVSTPYWHAVELLADDHGRLVPFGDSIATADAIIDLLDHPDECAAMGKRAYERGRRMIWPRLAETALVELQRAAADVPIRLAPPRPVSAQIETVPPSLVAVQRLSDDCGILQHSLYLVPNRDHGYCLDDNARALLLMHRINGRDADQADRMAISYASFVQHAWNGELGRFRNFMSHDRRWLEEAGSEDSCGRALWAIGVTANEARHQNLRIWASSLFDQAAPAALEVDALRAKGFAILGAVSMLAAHPGHGMARQILQQCGNDLRTQLIANRRDAWLWFEDILAYDNARLPEALIRAGLAISDNGMIADGLAALEWLREVQTAPDGHFRAVGTDSFNRRLKPPMPFDQQPVEACAMIDACAAALDATGDLQWRKQAMKAFAWFLGDNDLGMSLATRNDGGCYDGLMPDRVNLNQGAESVVSFQLACCAMMRIGAGSQSVPDGRRAAE